MATNIDFRKLVEGSPLVVNERPYVLCGKVELPGTEGTSYIFTEYRPNHKEPRERNIIVYNEDTIGNSRQPTKRELSTYLQRILNDCPGDQIKNIRSLSPDEVVLVDEIPYIVSRQDNVSATLKEPFSSTQLEIDESYMDTHVIEIPETESAMSTKYTGRELLDLTSQKETHLTGSKELTENETFSIRVSNGSSFDATYRGSTRNGNHRFEGSSGTRFIHDSLIGSDWVKICKTDKKVSDIETEKKIPQTGKNIREPNYNAPLGEDILERQIPAERTTMKFMRGALSNYMKANWGYISDQFCRMTGTENLDVNDTDVALKITYATNPWLFVTALNAYSLRNPAQIEDNLRAGLDAEIAMDDAVFMHSDTVHFGLPNWIPHNYVDLGKISYLDPKERKGREKILVSKQSVHERMLEAKKISLRCASLMERAHEIALLAQGNRRYTDTGIIKERNGKTVSNRTMYIENEAICRNTALDLQIYLQTAVTGTDQRSFVCKRKGNVISGDHAFNYLMDRWGAGELILADPTPNDRNTPFITSKGTFMYDIDPQTVREDGCLPHFIDSDTELPPLFNPRDLTIKGGENFFQVR